MDGSPPEFEDVARRLRDIKTTCEPPVGVGSFDFLYVNDHELVVWYSPSRDHQLPGEVVIACAALSLAWETLLGEGRLDEAALLAIGQSNWNARWLLAILAQIPGVSFIAEPLALEWRPSDFVTAPPLDPATEIRLASRGRKARARKSASGE